MRNQVGQGRAAHTSLAFTHSGAGHALHLPEIAHALIEGLIYPRGRGALARADHRVRSDQLGESRSRRDETTEDVAGFSEPGERGAMRSRPRPGCSRRERAESRRRGYSRDTPLEHGQGGPAHACSIAHGKDAGYGGLHLGRDQRNPASELRRMVMLGAAHLGKLDGRDETP